MRNDFYALGTITALISSELVSQNTRNILLSRLNKEVVTAPRYFKPEDFVTLCSVCARLIPQPDPARSVDLPGCLDEFLAEGKEKGWRYDAMPATGKAFIIGLHGFDSTSLSVFGRKFHQLEGKEQDNIIGLIQSGAAIGIIWDKMPAHLFFEELLAVLVELYYSHPYAKEDIGEASMADVHGWQRTDLNSREIFEPEAI